MMYLSANKDVGIPNNSIIAIKERTYYLLLHWQLLQFFKGRLGLLESALKYRFHYHYSVVFSFQS